MDVRAKKSLIPESALSLGAGSWSAWLTMLTMNLNSEAACHNLGHLRAVLFEEPIHCFNGYKAKESMYVCIYIYITAKTGRSY